MGKKSEALKHHADRTRVGRIVGYRATIDRDSAGVWLDETCNHPQHRCLTRAAWAKDGEESTSIDSDVDVVDREMIAKAFGDAFQSDHRF